MEKRKEAIIEALFEQANFFLDDHLKISTQQIPPIFRKGLRFGKAPEAVKSERKEKSAEVKSNDELVATKSGDITTPPASGQDNVSIQATLEQIKRMHKNLLLWIDDSNPKALFIKAKLAVARSHFGVALNCLQKMIDYQQAAPEAPHHIPLQDIQAAIAELVDVIIWKHCQVKIRSAEWLITDQNEDKSN